MSIGAAFVLGLGLGYLMHPLYDIAAHLLAGQPLIYPQES
jgi:hypothetical protein